MLEEVVISVAGPAAGGILGALAGRFSSNKALKACEKARKACNDKVHVLENRAEYLGSQIFFSQARIAGLETELDKRISALESRNAG